MIGLREKQVCCLLDEARCRPSEYLGRCGEASYVRWLLPEAFA